MSDHCPILISSMPQQTGYRFRFESYWAKLPNFLDVVKESWEKPVHSTDRLRVLHIKLSRLAKTLKRWSKNQIMPLKLSADIATEVVRLLDQAQEHRTLTTAELALHKKAKARILGFTAIRRIKIRQRSRLTWIRLGDANTKLFHLRASSRRRKNFIQSLQVNGTTVTRHVEKATALSTHFTSIFGEHRARQAAINWDQLNIQQHELSSLDAPFTEEEIKTAIFESPSEKAPGPDGYIGLFYKLCWSIIKNDIIQGLHQLYHLRGNRWSLLNSANIVLLAKKEDALQASDYRPISLMHSVAKILAKILANRLAPHLPNIVSPCQSAFIKGRSIQDNYQYIQGAINHFHRSKTPMIFLKLDIAKAFDSVRWEYLLEVMQRLGFGQRWRDLISIIWASTTSRILLNGIPGRPIKHRSGLRQGDPLSPMLFILAMDPLQRLLDRATQSGLLQPIGADPIRMRTSLYADDAALFVRPTATDIDNVQNLLGAFGAATGLKTNLQKSTLHMIHVSDDVATVLTERFQGSVAQFPCKYLGLPLHIGRTRRLDEQALVDKVAARLPGWKGRLLNRAGRLTLVNAVLTSIPVYHMTSFPLSKWAIKKIDRIRRNFLWKGSDDPRKGNCPVNWKRVCRCKALGGLGVKDLACFNRALRLRWPWFKWKEPSKPWAAMNIKLTGDELALFRLCTTVQIGDGNTASFWKDKWLHGQAPKDIAPGCYKLAWRKNQTVALAMANGTWMRGLRRIASEADLRQFVTLWSQLHQFQLSDQPDSITWRFTPDGQYTAKSAYQVQFMGAIRDNQWTKLWKAKVEHKCRFFMWLLLQCRLPTADRIIRRGGQANPICQLCHTTAESTLHMVAGCSFSSEVWSRMEQWSQFTLPPNRPRRLWAWWINLVQSVRPTTDQHLQVLIYTVWNIWKERCRRVFQRKAMTPEQLEAVIRADVRAYQEAKNSVE
ncbi:unnamed protein product [Urochloa humidicola]